MTLDLSLPALVNSGGGLAFAGAGVLALRHAHGDARGRLVALLAIAFGTTYLVGNLWPSVTAAALAAELLLQSLVLLAVVLLIRHVVRPLGRSSRRLFVAAAAIVTVATSASHVYSALHSEAILELAEPDLPADVAVLVAVGVGAFTTTTAALAILVCALALAYRETARDDIHERRALALLACAYGLFVAFAASFVLPIHLPLNAGLLVTLVPLAAWALVTDGPLPRNVTLALVGASGAGLVASALVWTYDLSWSTNYGIPGVLRTVGAFLVAIAVLRDGLSGAPTRPAAARQQAPLALAALAALLIVAQVAQNFLSASTSLLVGGLISGILVVAARPIERALDRRPSHASKADHDRAARERSFRAAARKFHKKDGYLSREEERELMIIAEHLGVPIARAYEIRDEVEAEVRS